MNYPGKFINLSEQDRMMPNIEKIVEEMRLGLQADGADVELAEKRPDGSLVLKLSGKSKGCNTIGISLEDSIAQYIKRANSEIQRIEFI